MWCDDCLEDVDFCRCRRPSRLRLWMAPLLAALVTAIHGPRR